MLFCDWCDFEFQKSRMGSKDHRGEQFLNLGATCSCCGGQSFACLARRNRFAGLGEYKTVTLTHTDRALLIVVEIGCKHIHMHIHIHIHILFLF